MSAYSGRVEEAHNTALPNFRIIPTLEHVDPPHDASSSGAPTKL